MYHITTTTEISNLVVFENPTSSIIGDLDAFTPKEKDETLKALMKARGVNADSLKYEWDLYRRREQILISETEFTNVVYSGKRNTGKTRTAAEIMRGMCLENPIMAAVVSPFPRNAQIVLNFFKPGEIKKISVNSSTLKSQNGSDILCVSPLSIDKMRGIEVDLLWIDECFGDFSHVGGLSSIRYKKMLVTESETTSDITLLNNTATVIFKQDTYQFNNITVKHSDNLHSLCGWKVYSTWTT